MNARHMLVVADVIFRKNYPQSFYDRKLDDENTGIRTISVNDQKEFMSVSAVSVDLELAKGACPTIRTIPAAVHELKNWPRNMSLDSSILFGIDSWLRFKDPEEDEDDGNGDCEVNLFMDPINGNDLSAKEWANLLNYLWCEDGTTVLVEIVDSEGKIVDDRPIDTAHTGMSLEDVAVGIEECMMNDLLPLFWFTGAGSPNEGDNFTHLIMATKEDRDKLFLTASGWAELYPGEPLDSPRFTDTLS